MRELYDSRTRTVQEIADLFGTNRTTVYDYLRAAAS
jgi:predicted DNA binding protein